MADESINFVNLAVAAEYLGIAKSTAYDAANEEGHLCNIPIIKVGRRYLISRKALAALAKS